MTLDSYFPVKNLPADPNQMGVDAAAGDLVMVNVGFWKLVGNTLHRHGGHEVAYRQGKTSAFTTSDTIHVMDPDDPGTDNHFQMPYHSDQWVLKKATGLFGLHGLWEVWRYGQQEQGTYYQGWSEIDPELVIGADAPTIVVDSPFSFAAAGHSRSTQRLKLAGKARVVDLAISPEGFAEPFLRAGSSTIFEVNRLTGKTTRYAAGPAGASHLTYGGPDETLFVAGTHDLVALAPNRRTIASMQLSHRVDALTYDQHDGLPVALLAAKHRIEFLSRSLRVVGSAPIPKSLLAGAGGFSLAIGPPDACSSIVMVSQRS